MTSEKWAPKLHSDDASLPRSGEFLCLNQISNAARPIRSTAQIWVVTSHQYGISALVSQTSFGRETSGSVAKCRLFSQARITQTMGTRLGLSMLQTKPPQNDETKRKVNFTYLFFYWDKVPVSNRVFTEEIKLHYMFLVFPLIMQFYTQQSKSHDEYGITNKSYTRNWGKKCL